MTTKNPFPGMNPFFEQRWQDAHTMLIAYIRDALQPRLPEDLVAGAEEQLVTIGAEDQPNPIRSDVSVKEPWNSGGQGGVAVAPPERVRAPSATQPTRVFIEDEVERWVEIHDPGGRLVTVIELVSPANKTEAAARERFQKRRVVFLGGGANLVEIDLVRKGWSVFPDEVGMLAQSMRASYGVCVYVASGLRQREAYVMGLCDRLPVLSIPLRPTDADVPLDLQALVDQCHERGRYHLLRYSAELDPPLASCDAAWVDQLMREHKLR
jgi:hypothetical protein